MAFPTKLIEQLREAFGKLTKRFGFALHIEEEELLLSLRSPSCIIDIVFERYEDGFSVSLTNPQDKLIEYNYLVLMSMRCPGYPERGYNRSLSKEQNLLCYIDELCENLISYFPDLLSGDFTAIQREGYVELASYINARMPLVVNMELDDPISVKFWRGDLTWARDLREREQRTHQARQSN
jgi:hypothetical protein